MQPHYEMANTLHQELTVDDCCSSTLHTPGPLRPNQNGHHLLQHYYSQFQQQHPQPKQQQNELCHEYEQVYQLRQYPHQFQPSQQEQSHYLGGNGIHHCEDPPHHLGVTKYHQPQEESTARVSFWKSFNAVLSDAKEKHQQFSQNFGELEAVYILARNKETTQTFSHSALAVENSHAAANVGLPLGDCNQPKVLATAKTGVDTFFGEHASMKRSRKRTRKTKLEEEMSLVTAFFKRLVKRVIDHQQVLQNKLLQVVERMEKERAEREEAWRHQETEIYDREAIAKAHERDLASRRESAIVSTIEKITGQSFNLVSNKTRDQLSTIYEN